MSSNSPKPAADVGVFPFLNSNMYDYLTFGWLTSLLVTGSKRPLQMTDLWNPHPKNSAAYCSDIFTPEWEKEKLKPDKSLGRVLIRVYRYRMLLALAEKVLSTAASIGSSFILGKILLYLACSDPYYPCPDNTLRDGLIFCFLFLIVPLTGSILTQIYTFEAWQIGSNMRTSLISTLYRKALLVSSSARQQESLGKIVNIMSNDAFTVLMAMAFGFELVVAVPTLLACGVLLFFYCDWVAALAGILMIPICIPFSGKLGRAMFQQNEFVVKTSDGRIKIENEFLQGIKIVKQNGWEQSFIDAVAQKRGLEIDGVKKVNKIQASLFTLMTLVPFLVLVVLFIVQYARSENGLSITSAYYIINIVNVMRAPLIWLPIGIGIVSQAKVALNRMDQFLAAEEVRERKPVPLPEGVVIELSANAKTRWGVEKKPAAAAQPPPPPPPPAANKKNGKAGKDGTPLQILPTNANPSDAPDFVLCGWEQPFQARKGQLIAIVGQTGSGKTTLISALLGELHPFEGHAALQGSVAFAAQEAWIQNATVKDNILLGKPWDESKYNGTLSAVALEADLKTFSAGDQTEIGERGINLSGGQRARVSLARLVYADADICIMDDPLSAVDAHVAKHIFEKCILQTLAGKTRILVTHRVEVLPKCDLVVVMEKGKIIDIGTANELNQRCEHYRFVCQHDTGNEEEEKAPHAVLVPQASGGVLPARSRESSKAEKENDAAVQQHTAAEGVLVQKEDRDTGAVSLAVWKEFLAAAGGIGTVFAVFILSSIQQSSNILTTWFCGWWTEQVAYKKSSHPYGFYAGIAIMLVVVQATTLGGRALVLTNALVKASASLHVKLVASVLRAPMWFFDTTPMGRILNRMTKDQQQIDLQLGSQALGVVNLSFFIVASLILQITVMPVLIVTAPFIFYVLWKAFIFFLASGRELKRLDSISYSPIFSHVAETMDGVETIRAYKMSEKFVVLGYDLIDTNTRAFLPTVAATSWIGFRVGIPVQILGFGVAIIALFIKTWGYVNGASIGVALTYSLATVQIFSFLLRGLGEVEKFMTSVQRILGYSHLDEEGIESRNNQLPEAQWPRNGQITFADFRMRYRPGLPEVLCNVNINIQGGEKVGIAGRSGCGKSSLIVALTRIVEGCGGAIIIDGINIAQVPLQRLRQSIVVIPQEPILFSGTLRYNLDPFGIYKDQEIMRCIECVALTDAISNLDQMVSEGGDNFSVGQRQLLCIARALLRKPKIVLLDEATASVDNQTDSRIQFMIRSEFKDATVLTIAHRLVTIIDSDKVVLMDKGVAAEIAKPHELLIQPNSKFSRLVDETGPVYAAFLRKLAADVARGQQLDFTKLNTEVPELEKAADALLAPTPHDTFLPAAAAADISSPPYSIPNVPHEYSAYDQQPAAYDYNQYNQYNQQQQQQQQDYGQQQQQYDYSQQQYNYSQQADYQADYSQQPQQQPYQPPQDQNAYWQQQQQQQL